MPIPASGPISMSMFNTELGRTSTTADSLLAGGTVPTTGSLFWLANQSGSLNQTAPHSMNEWYGYSTSATILGTYTKTGTNPPTVAYRLISGSTNLTNITVTGTDSDSVPNNTPLTASVTITAQSGPPKAVTLTLIVKNITDGTTLSSQGPTNFTPVNSNLTFQWTGSAGKLYHVTASASNT